jgi:lysophospholipase L1-like esterase
MVRRTLVNAALLLGSLALSLGIIELVLRTFHPLDQRVRFGTIVLPTNRSETVRNDDVPDLPRVVVKRRNSLGFRGPEPPVPFARYLTIVTVGGSTTEASYEPDGRTWTDRLGARLARCFTDSWINNAGFDGHSTFAHLALLREHLVRLRPNVALFLVGANDRWREEPSTWDREIGVGPIDFSSPSGLGKSIAARLETVALLLNLYRSVTAWQAGAWYSRIAWEAVAEDGLHPPAAARLLAHDRAKRIPAYRERLQAIARTAHDAGILPIFITQPIVFGPGRDPATGKHLRRLLGGAFELKRMERFNDALRAVAAEEGVPMIELARQMPHDTRLFFDTVHYTSRGEEMVAEIVHRDVRTILAARWPAHLRPECRPSGSDAEPSRRRDESATTATPDAARGP